MPLTPGQRLGPYDIVGPLGAGGMGEVYRAKDTKLGREVALKILPDLFAHDPERLARFEREARTLASLNHPHIAQLYGVEDSGATHALVMELVEGTTLADRLTHGPIPLADALPIASQIADALDAAHEHAIIHRDLKPANIKVRDDGTVKVLDFGLAKAMGPGPEGPGLQGDAANSPTLTVRGTQMGMIIGTAAYMSPEQARGKVVDRRADIWAFGVVLLEMLTGRRAFEGEDISTTLAAVLTREPDWTALPASTPRAVRQLIVRCLDRDVKQRLRDIGEARILIDRLIAGKTDDAGSTARGETTAAVAVVPFWRRALPWAIAVLFAGTSLAPWLVHPAPLALAGPTVRATLPFASAEALTVNAYPTIALSPDGRFLAYRGGAPSQLYVRAMDEGQSRALAGTEGALYPFFSPDGASLGFLAGRSIKRMALGGGAPVTVVNLTTANLRGVAWGDDGGIYYTPTVSAGLWRIPAAGGTPEQLTTPDFAAGEKTHRFPFVLPGSKALLFMVGTSSITSFDDARIEVLSIGTRTRHRLIDGGTYPQYVSSKHILYTQNGRLIAVPFDAKALALTGAPVAVASGMFSDPFYGMGNFGVSRDGLFVRVVGGATTVPQSLAMLDRQGRSQLVPMTPTVFAALGRVSPDGSRFATYLIGATSQIAVFDLRRGSMTRLTYEWDNEAPVWSPDGLRMAFVSNHGGGPRSVYWRRADGGGDATRLTSSTHEQTVSSWSPDGKTLAFVDTDPVSGGDIWTVSVDDHAAKVLVQSPAEDLAPMFSPDGHWIAYQSSQSGRAEIYVQAFPTAPRRFQVSTDGGTLPFWQRSGRELIFRRGTSIMAASITLTPDFHSGEPVKLFDTPNVPLDLLPDGRLLTRTATPIPPVTELEIVVNWFAELLRKTGGR